MDMPSEVVEQLLDAGLKCSFFRLLFVFWQFRCSYLAFLYHCRMTHDDGGLRCSVFWKVCIHTLVGDWWRSNQRQHWIFYSSVNWFITPNEALTPKIKTYQLFYIIVFRHEMLALVCNGRYLYRAIKSGTLSKHFNNSLSNDISIMFQR